MERVIGLSISKGRELWGCFEDLERAMELSRGHGESYGAA